MKKMLVITPDLSLNGANVVLYELLEILSDKIQCHLIASADGEFGNKLNGINVSYEIQSTVTKNSINTNSYDMVFLNTSSVHYYALLLQNTPIPVYWWFHESYEQLVQQQNIVHLGLLSDNFKFFGVTPKVIRGLKELFGVNALLLPMAVKDVNEHTKHIIEPIVFIPGAYSYIKGQDILIKAIARLPKNLLDSFTFVFAGYKLDSQENYYRELKQLATIVPGINILDTIDREEVYEYYKKSVCVVAPSRVDSTPTTIVEALMFGKLCIVSTGAGISELMTDCTNGFVYPCENEEELYKRLLLVLNDYNNLEFIQQGARELYNKYFSVGQVKNLLEVYLDLQD